MKKADPSIGSMRGAMNDYQRELIEEVWRCFRAGGKWPILRGLYSKYGKAKVRDALSSRPLGGSVGRESSGSERWTVYKLSLLGVLLTSEGPRFRELLAKFLGFQRDLCRRDPQKSHLPAAEIASALALDAEQVNLLGQLLSFAGLGGSEQKSTTWGANAMEEAEDFLEKGDLSPEVDRLAFRFYEPEAPVFEEERRMRDLRRGSAQPVLVQALGAIGESFTTFSPAKSSYQPNTAFILMWMDEKAHPELEDVAKAI